MKKALHASLRQAMLSRGFLTGTIGTALYIVLATFLYLAFILMSTSLVCMRQSFIGNMWSETAAILGYFGAGQAVALLA